MIMMMMMMIMINGQLHALAASLMRGTLAIQEPEGWIGPRIRQDAQEDCILHLTDIEPRLPRSPARTQFT
jgi:hypothetical protein